MVIQNRSLKETCYFTYKNYYENLPSGWEYVPLGKIGTLTRGAGIKRSETIESGYPCIRYGELYTTYKTSFTVAQSYTSFEVYSKAYKVHKNDILMSLTGENKEDISKGLAYLGNEEIAMGGDIACLSNHNMNQIGRAHV